MTTIQEIIQWKENGGISCICGFQDYLFVGSSTGDIGMYRLYEAQSRISGMMNYRVLSVRVLDVSKKGIKQMEVDNEAGLLFVLTDGCIQVYEFVEDDLVFLYNVDGIKNCTNFCLFKGRIEKLKNSICCIVKKKFVHFLRYSIDKCVYIKEIKLSNMESITSVLWINKYICMGFKYNFMVVNYITEERDLTFDAMNINNLLSNNYHQYFEFVTIIGKYDRTAMFPTEESQKMCISFPSIVSSGHKQVEVFNLYEHTITDNFDLPRHYSLFSVSNHVYVASNKSVSLLKPLPLESQIHQMISEDRILQAFGLFEKTFEGPEEKKQLLLKSLREEAGYSCFFRARFKEAFQFFQESRLDPRDIIFYFPELLAKDSSYSPEIDKGNLTVNLSEYECKLKGMPPTTAMIKLRIKHAKKSLLQHLETIRSEGDSTWSEEVQQAIDHALLKLYLDEVKNYTALKKLVKNSNHLKISDCKDLFKDHAVFYSFLLFSKGKRDKAMGVLEKLGHGEVVEKAFSTNGIPEMVELILESKDEEFAFQYAELAHDMDSIQAVKMFITSEIDYNISRVLQFLTLYPSDIQRHYLEYLVYDQKTECSTYVNQLISNYIDTIHLLKPPAYLPQGVRVEAGEEVGPVGKIRKKLLELLKYNPIYDVKKVLKHLESTTLFEEMMVLFRKLGDHHASLRLLIHNLEDFDWAERYCVEIYQERIKHVSESFDNGYTRIRAEELQNLSYNPYLLELLHICFHEEPKNEEFGKEILRKHAKQINPIDCLQIIPNTFPIHQLEDFLRKVIQHTFDRHQETTIMSRICSRNNMKQSVILADYQSRSLCVKENSFCKVCWKPIGDRGVVAIYPDISIFHFKCCGNDLNRHPLTRHNFLAFPHRYRTNKISPNVSSHESE